MEPDTLPYLPPPGLPPTFIEAADFEEEADLYLGCRVLAHKHRTGMGSTLANTPILEYGTILKKHNDLIFCVQFDDTERRWVGRQYIEAITKRTFFVSIDRGIWGWTIEEAAEANRKVISVHFTLIDI